MQNNSDLMLTLHIIKRQIRKHFPLLLHVEFLDIDSIDWPPLVHLIYNVAEHGGIAVSGCVCPYSVCLALPVTGRGRAQCVIGFEGSAALTFWAAGVKRGRTVHNAQRPESVRRCCSVSVYLCCCSSSIYFNFSLKLSLNWLLNTPSIPSHPKPPPPPLNSSVHCLHTLASLLLLGFLLLSV